MTPPCPGRATAALDRLRRGLGELRGLVVGGRRPAGHARPADNDLRGLLDDVRRARDDAEGMEPARIDELVAAWRRLGAAPELAVEPPTFRAGVLAGTAAALTDRYRVLADPADLDAAIDACAEAAQLADDDDIAISVAADLGRLRHLRYSRTGDPAELARGIAEIRARRRARPGLGRPDLLNIHAVLLQARYAIDGDSADLEQAVDNLRDAVAGSVGEAERNGLSSNLAVALRTRYERTGSSADLAEATRLSQRAVDVAGADGNRAGFLTNLAGALRDSIEQATDVVADTEADAPLDAAVVAASEALAAAPNVTLERPGYLHNCGLARLGRYRRTGALADLEAAVSYFAEAVASSAETAPDQLHFLDAYGVTLLESAERLRRQDDLRLALGALRRALDATGPRAPERPARLDNLGNAYSARYRHGTDEADLDRAVAAYYDAVATLPESAPAWPRLVNDLAGGLWDLYHRDEDPTVLDRAIEAYEAAAARLPPGAPALPSILNNLGNALAARHELGGHADADRRRVREAYRRACSEGAATSRAAVLEASTNWGRWASRHDDWTEAVTAYRHGAAVLADLFAGQALREHKESWLRAAVGLSANAGYAFARVRDLPAAVLAVETGRALLMSEAMAGRIHPSGPTESRSAVSRPVAPRP